MSFGLNRAEVIGRLGADVTANHLVSGGRVANLSIATDEGYIDRNSGERVDRTEWHRVVTFQPGLVDMLVKNAKKGRLIYVAGKMQTRALAQGRRGQRPLLDRDPAGARFAHPVPGPAGRRQRQRRRRARRRGPSERSRHAGRRHPVADGGHGRDPVLSHFLPSASGGPALRRRSPFILQRTPNPPPHPKMENLMPDIAFRRIAEDEARILADGEHVGDLYRRPDILNCRMRTGRRRSQEYHRQKGDG